MHKIYMKTYNGDYKRKVLNRDYQGLYINSTT